MPAEIISFPKPPRETIAGTVRIDYAHKKQLGGSGEFARIILALEPGERSSGVRIVDEVAGGAVPKNYISGVEAGVRRGLKSGLLTRGGVTDIVVRIQDGAYHDVDSSVAAFEKAAYEAVRQGLEKAGTVLIEDA